MQVMVLVKATAESEAGGLPDPALLDAMGRFNAELVEAGVLVTAGGLLATSGGKRVRFEGGARTVSDGPFAPAGDQVAGFWLWEVADLDEAVAWARRFPNPMPGPSDLELRPLQVLAHD